MPYKLQSSGSGFFVVDDAGKKYSDKPMPKWMATRQMKALYASEKKEFINHTESMVALPIPEAYQLVQGLEFPEGSEVLPPYEMHVTMAFLGDVTDGSVDPEKLFAAVEKFAAGQTPIIGKINGYGVFTETHMEDMECLWLNLDAPTLPEMRQELIDYLGKNGFTPAMDHGFTPHITVAYFPKGFTPTALDFEPQSVMILSLRVAWADLVRDFPFGVVAMNKEKLTNDVPSRGKGFRAFKQADGSYRWILFSSSSFRDRDGEIITGKALAEDVERCDAAKEYGPLRWWHVGGWEYPDGPEQWQTWKAGDGLDLGACDFNMLHGKMLIESGTFKDAVIGEAIAQIQDDLEASIMFSHPADEPGKSKEYQNIHRLERSLLPAGMASNLLTKLYVSKGETTMKISEKLAALSAILKDKPDVAQQILADAEAIQKAAELVGLDSKEVSEMFEVKAEETPAEPVVEPPAEVVPVVDPAPARVDASAVDEIGDMTHAQLAAFVSEAVKQSLPQADPTAEAKQAGQEQLLSDALLSLKAITDRLIATETTVKETKQALDELTDARPVGIKQLQNQRPTESAANVVKTAPTGPTMDPGFLKLVTGGK